MPAPQGWGLLPAHCPFSAGTHFFQRGAGLKERSISSVLLRMCLFPQNPSLMRADAFHTKEVKQQLVGAHRALGSLINSHTPGAHPAQDPAPGMQHRSPQQHLDCPARWAQQSHHSSCCQILPGPSSTARAARAAESPPRQAWSSIPVAMHSPSPARPLDTGILRHRMVSRGRGRRASGILISWQVL